MENKNTDTWYTVHNITEFLGMPPIEPHSEFLDMYAEDTFTENLVVWNTDEGVIQLDIEKLEIGFVDCSWMRYPCDNTTMYAIIGFALSHGYTTADYYTLEYLTSDAVR